MNKITDVKKELAKTREKLVSLVNKRDSLEKIAKSNVRNIIPKKLSTFIKDFKVEARGTHILYDKRIRVTAAFNKAGLSIRVWGYVSSDISRGINKARNDIFKLQMQEQKLSTQLYNLIEKELNK